MADGNQLKTGHQVDVPDDDPFAELTRIMGFDPRQSVKQAEAANRQAEAARSPVSDAPRQVARDVQPAADHSSNDDDFSIDLEKELMGEFSADEQDDFAALDFSEDETPVVDEPAVKPAAVAAEESADEAEIDFDFDEAIAASVSDDVAADRDAPELQADPAPSVDFDAREPASAGVSDDDLDITADFDAAMSDVDFEPAAESEDYPDMGASALDPEDFRLETDDLQLEDDDLDLDSAELDGDFEEQALNTVETTVDEFRLEPADLHFETDAVEDASDGPAAADLHLNAADERNEPEIEFDAADLDLTEADAPSDDAEVDFEDLRFDDNDFDAEDTYTQQEDPAPVQARTPYGEPDRHAAPAPFEVEEHNASTGRDFAAYDASSTAVADPVQAPRSPMDEAAAEYRGRSAGPVDLSSSFDLEAELNALLGNRSVETKPVEEPAYASRPEERAASGASGDLDWELEDLVEAVAAAEHDDDPQASGQYSTDDFRPEPSFPRSFGPQGEAPSALDDLYSAAAAASAVRVAPKAAPAQRSEVSPPSPAFSERYQQRADHSNGSIDSAASSAWPSARAYAPRDAAHEDPLDIIEELTAKYSRPEPVAYPASGNRAMKDRYEEVPDVETIEVADRAVALADDLDIPELDFEEELPPVSAYDDLDTDFSSLLNDMNDSDAMPADLPRGYADVAGTTYAGRDDPYRANAAAPVVRAGAASTIPGVRPHDQDAFSLDTDDLPDSRLTAGAPYGDDYDYNPDLDDALAVPGMAAAHQEARPPRRGLLVAGIVGGVALIGALGAFALSFGNDGDADTLAIVKADDGPIKVRPENPGGTNVPNQDSKVYQTVVGEGTSTDPQQEKLVTTAEEPVDMTPVEDDPVVAGKSEDRIEQILQEAEGQSDAEIAAVAPRKVRTLVVRPDGTLVPREESDAAGTTDNDIRTDAVTSGQEAIVDTAGAEDPDAGAALAELGDNPVEVDQQVASVEPAATEPSGQTPADAPIAPPRPSEQPVDVVGEVKPDQVASAATSAAGGAWSMQIASQPSEAAAQASYQNLLSRYGSVLNGREANIVKADIAGKGTFWRVRIPAPTRNEAISLCESYKSAGGNCFVSK